MKNNLSSERNIAAFNDSVEGMTGMLLLGAAGGGPGAVAVEKVGTTSSIISAIPSVRLPGRLTRD